MPVYLVASDERPVVGRDDLGGYDVSVFHRDGAELDVRIGLGAARLSMNATTPEVWANARNGNVIYFHCD